MKRLRHLLLLAGFAGLSACSSAPIHYYTLLPPSVPDAESGQPSPFLIEVLPVAVPAQADQPQLVVRQGGSGVAVLEGERWAGPLGEEVRTALSESLSRLLATQDVAGIARPADRPLMRIKVRVRRFELWSGHGAQIDAEWSLGMADEPGNARLACHARLEAPAVGGYPELVQAQQRLIAELADRIAADARAWSLSRHAVCTGKSF